MFIAKRDFNERFQNMKPYKKGDTYSGDEKRVAFLVAEGYLAEVKETPKKKKGD